jgi:peptide/nickel transport system substrate-binding protein
MDAQVVIFRYRNLVRKFSKNLLSGKEEHMKRLTILVVTLLVLAFIFAGCSSTPSTPASTFSPSSSAPVSTPPPNTGLPSATPPKTTAVPATLPATVPVATPTSPAITGTYGGTLRYVLAAGPGTPLDPWEATGGTISTMQFSVQPLLREDLPGVLVPVLATSWETNPTANPPNIVFHLRQGVKFSDGSDFNAQAVKWNFDMTKQGGMQAGTTNYWQSVDVVDNNTVKISFPFWRNTWLRGFSENVAFISSPTAYQKNGVDWVRLNMVGTGPFNQTSYVRDVALKTVKNPGYWDTGYPYLDSVNILYVADQLTRDALFKSGGADLTAIASSEAAQFQSPNFKVITQQTGNSGLFPDSLNDDSPWSKLEVRQAAEYAIDKAGLAKAFGYGYTTAAYQMPSPVNMAYDPKFAGARIYDVAKAKQLLITAGYPNGFKSTIIDCFPGSQDVVNIITAIQAQLAAVGIQCDLQFPQSAQAQAYLSGTWHNALLYDPILEWVNPNTQLNFFFGAPTSSWFKSMKKPSGWNDIVTASVQAPNVDVALAQKAYKALYDDCSFVTLTYGTNLWVTGSNIQGSGLGTRGNTAYFNPQYTWFGK